MTLEKFYSHSKLRSISHIIISYSCSCNLFLDVNNNFFSLEGNLISQIPLQHTWSYGIERIYNFTIESSIVSLVYLSLNNTTLVYQLSAKKRLLELQSIPFQSILFKDSKFLGLGVHSGLTCYSTKTYTLTPTKACLFIFTLQKHTHLNKLVYIKLHKLFNYTCSGRHGAQTQS